MSKWQPVGVELIRVPLDQELFQNYLDEIAELLYVESRQHSSLPTSSTDLVFENKSQEINS